MQGIVTAQHVLHCFVYDCFVDVQQHVLMIVYYHCCKGDWKDDSKGKG